MAVATIVAIRKEYGGGRHSALTPVIALDAVHDTSVVVAAVLILRCKHVGDELLLAWCCLEAKDEWVTRFSG